MYNKKCFGDEGESFMKGVRFKQIIPGLLCLSLGSVSALAVDLSTMGRLSIQVSEGVETIGKGCKSSLLNCPGIRICPNCQNIPSSATITISNNTAVNAQGVTITTSYPNFSTYAAQSGTCGTGSFSLNAGSSCTVTFSTTGTSAPYPGFTTTLVVAGTNVQQSSFGFIYDLNG